MIGLGRLYAAERDGMIVKTDTSRSGEFSGRSECKQYSELARVCLFGPA
jgi:hypothetical protein